MSYAVGLVIKQRRTFKISKYIWYLIWALDIVAAVIIYYRPDLIVMGFK